LTELSGLIVTKKKEKDDLDLQKKTLTDSLDAEPFKEPKSTTTPASPDQHNDETDSINDTAESFLYFSWLFLIIFIILFIYNIIKCYAKQLNAEKPVDAKQYSRELQEHTQEDDSILDLTGS